MRVGIRHLIPLILCLYPSSVNFLQTTAKPDKSCPQITHFSEDIWISELLKWGVGIFKGNTLFCSTSIAFNDPQVTPDVLGKGTMVKMGRGGDFKSSFQLAFVELPVAFFKSNETITSGHHIHDWPFHLFLYGNPVCSHLRSSTILCCLYGLLC